LRGNSSNSGRFSHYIRKSSELWMVHNPEPHEEVYLNNLSFYMSHVNKYFHWLISLSVIRKIFKQIHLYTHHLYKSNVKLPCFQKSTFYARIKLFNILPLSLTILKNDKTKLKSALRKHLNTPSFSLQMSFLCVKMIYNNAL